MKQVPYADLIGTSGFVQINGRGLDPLQRSDPVQTAQDEPGEPGPTPILSLVRNRMLAALDPAEFSLLGPHLRHVSLKKHQVLQDINRQVDRVTFVERGAVSIMSRTRKDGAVEVGVVGRFGCVGIPVLLGTGRSPYRAVVRIAGDAFTVGAGELNALRPRLPGFQRVANQYIQARLVQHTQVSLCNVRHTINERLCRWLLLIRDRLGDDEIPVTHELLSQALGVRRAGVTESVAHLESRGAIRGARGRIRIVDVEALENCACECYRIIKDEYDRMLVAPTRPG